jgi:hypothetical protein
MKLTQTIHLSLLGSALVVAGCSRTEGDDKKDDDKDKGRGHGHSTYTHAWFPRYYGGSGVRSTTPIPSSPASSRGGFGSTGHATAGPAGT